jgi:RimJ/RimL family protein N-acetyltransferase
MKTPFIVGERVYLTGIEKADLPSLVDWMNDSEMTHYLFMGDRPAHLELLIEQWEREIKDPGEIVFAIIEKEKDEMIGWGGLYSINWISRSAEYRVFIGNKSCRNKGIGTEVAKVIIKYGFEKLNLNKVLLGVNTSHKGAVRSYEKAGFVKEGILRQEIYRNSKYYDVVRMGILREEYYKEHKQEGSQDTPDVFEN